MIAPEIHVPVLVRGAPAVVLAEHGQTWLPQVEARAVQERLASSIAIENGAGIGVVRHGRLHGVQIAEEGQEIVAGPADADALGHRFVVCREVGMRDRKARQVGVDERRTSCAPGRGQAAERQALQGKECP